MTPAWDLPSPFIHRVSAQDARLRVDLDSGRPKRMPAEFVDRYRPLPEVAAALAEEHHRRFAPGVEPREI